MAKTLLENYANRIRVAESVYAKEHNGETMSKAKKLTVAAVLNNTNKFLQERFENSVGTQRSDIGNYKKFVLNLTNIAMPNLLAFDLVMVKPMTSRAGFVTYIDFVAGSNKGGVEQGDVFNSGLKGLGKMDAARAAYTSAKVVEDAVANATTAWKPVDGKVEKFAGLDSQGEAIWEEIAVEAIVAGDKIRYEYDNVVIPQEDLPILNAVTRDIPIAAKTRRIAIYYSQIAAFEMKNEMGEDLGQSLAEQAVGELKYEIDSEVVMFLRKMAGEPVDALTFNKHVPVGITLAQHYEGFGEKLEQAKVALYNRTQRYMPSYMVCASDVLPILAYCPTFKMGNMKAISGPFVAGTLGGLKVVVSPLMASGEYFFGVNEGMASAAIYAPYMAIVPTQLLGFADGAMSQGFSTMYGLAELNKELLIAGKVVDETAEGAVAVING